MDKNRTLDKRLLQTKIISVRIEVDDNDSMPVSDWDLIFYFKKTTA